MAGTYLAPRSLGSVLGLAALLALGAGAAAQEKVGVDSAVDQSANGTPPSAPTRRLELGEDILHNERIVTTSDGQTQVLLLDASALTVGPSSDVTIDNFVYDPNTGTGQMAMSATRGVMRFVGGKISKQDNAVTMNTPVASLGIRGGVFLLSISPSGKLDVVFLYGKALTVTANGQTQMVTRPGWSVAVNGQGATPSPPAPASANTVATILALLSGRPGASGGSAHPPTNASLANSTVPRFVSADVTASTAQAVAAAPPKSQPPVVTVSTLPANTQIQTVAIQPVVAAVSGSSSSASAVTPVSSSSSSSNSNSSSNSTTPLNPSSPTSPTTPTTPTSPTNPTSPSGPVETPTVALPTMGAGSFTGTAMGTVMNNGATYQATGGFNQTYNFGSGTGIANISNFDGANYTYRVTGSGANFSGGLTSGPASRTGSISGSFSGPGAIQSSGNFGVQSTAGPTYTATGTFSGR
jgi:hypothetical protein